MNGWGWVIAGYGIALVVLSAYAWSISVRAAVARRKLQDLG